MSRSVEEMEQWARNELAKLHREYQAKAEPLIKMLVSIEAMKPPKPIMISLEDIRTGRFSGDKR